MPTRHSGPAQSAGPGIHNRNRRRIGAAGIMDSGFAATRRPGMTGQGFLRRGAAGAHQRDAVELGLLGGVFRLALAHLIALVEQFNLLELVEGLAQA